MATNYGLGFGAFMAGLDRGMATGERLKKAWDEKDAQDARDAAMKDAQKQREDAVSSKMASLMGLGEPAAPQAPQMTADAVPPEQAGAVQTAQAAPVAVDNPQGTPVDPAVQKTGAGLAGVTPVQPASTGAGVAALRVANRPDAPQPQMIPASAPAAAPVVPPAQQQVPGAAPGVTAPQAENLSPRLAAVGLPTARMSEKDARAEAERTVPTVIEFFQKTGVPRMAEVYIKQGNPEKAAAWEKWSEDETARKNVKVWAQAYKAIESGDWQTAGDKITHLYSHYQDGQTVMGKPEIVKDKAGEVTGFNVRVKDDASGQERAQFIPRDDLAKMGLVALSPPQMFEAVWKQKTAEDAAKRAAQADMGKARIKLASDMALKQFEMTGKAKQAEQDHEYDMERDAAKAATARKDDTNKVQRDFEAKKQILLDAGRSQEFIDSLTPEMLGLDSTRKQASDSELRARIMSDIMKGDPRAFAKMSGDQQRAKVEELLTLVKGGVSSDKNASSSSKSAPTPAKTAAKNGVKLEPYLDNQTGKVVFR